MSYSFIPNIVPVAASHQAAAIAMEAWEEAFDAASISKEYAALKAHPVIAPFLEGIAGSSPYLAHLITRHPRTLLQSFVEGPAQSLNRWLTTPLEEQGGTTPESNLRLLKRRTALVIAMADLAHAWPADKVTKELSRLADLSIQHAVSIMIEKLVARGILAPCTAENSGIFVLAMGKLGAHELNYSSDIDLILYYDPERLPFTGEEPPRQALVRACQEMVSLLQERTADGYVFRVDLRLRPDPFSTPIIMSTRAALTYYESVGQNWERACYIKARAAAGDMEAASDFLSSLIPYIWRKHLDFAAIADIQSIKRQIDSQHGTAPEDLAGHDIKLGAGGIRDIELYVQTMQLIWGGREPSLRQRGTVDALARLAKRGLIPDHARHDLTKAYYELRRLEHAIQMVDDQQQHHLAEDAEGRLQVAGLLGFDDLPSFHHYVHNLLNTVTRHCRPLFSEQKPLSATTESGQGNLVFTGNDEDPETTKNLEKLGFTDTAMVSQLIRQWHSGTCRAMRSAKARELMTEIIPDLLLAIATTSHPDRCFRNVNQLLFALPTGVQFLSLLYHQKEMISLLVNILDSSPRLSEIISQFPFVLDRYLVLRKRASLPDKAAMAEELATMLTHSDDREAALHLCRQYNHEMSFVTATRMLRQETSLAEGGRQFAMLADVTMTEVWRQISADMEQSYGMPEQGESAIIALGKWGSDYMTLASDLDIIITYSATGQGECRLSPEIYYNRLAQRFVTAVSGRMQYGQLYALDLRLRPYGNDGPTACSIDALEEYTRSAAWTYEKLAFIRARTVTGHQAIRQRISHWLEETFQKARTMHDLRADLQILREKIHANLKPRHWWDVKHPPGGLLDVELVIEWLLLEHIPDHAEIWHPDLSSALDRMQQSAIIPGDAAETLQSNMQQMLAIQQWVRLCYHDDDSMEELSDITISRISQALGMDSAASLRERLLDMFESNRKIISTLLDRR